VKEFLQGRRLGFSPRSHLAFVAGGLALAVTIADVMAWLGLGSTDTNGYVIVAQWLCVVTMVLALVAGIAAATEIFDVIPEEHDLARMDALAAVAIVLIYGLSAFLRSLELGNAAASPAPFLLSVAGLIVIFADAGLAANMYSSREWEEIEEEPAREHRRRRASR
jgi:hypothetical protein